MDTGGELILVKGYVGENSARLSGHQAVINSQNTLSHLEPLFLPENTHRLHVLSIPVALFSGSSRLSSGQLVSPPFLGAVAFLQTEGYHQLVIVQLLQE